MKTSEELSAKAAVISKLSLRTADRLDERVDPEHIKVVMGLGRKILC